MAMTFVNQEHLEVLPTPKTFPQILATSLKLPPFPTLSLLPYPFLLPCTMATAPTLSKPGALFFFFFLYVLFF